jgi:hypothetical protein
MLPPILDFIKSVRESFGGAEFVYTNGSCYKFARMLQSIYGGEVVDRAAHQVLLLDGRLYDITGDLGKAFKYNDDDEKYRDYAVLEGRQLAFYENEHARFDLSLDKDKINPIFGMDQLQTLVVREAQLLEWDYGVEVVASMIVSQWPVGKDQPILCVATEDSKELQDYITQSIEISQQGRRIFLYLKWPQEV